MDFDELIKLVSSDKAPHICTDSRNVKAGDVFIAIDGTVYNGHNFITQAITNGARYIVCQRDTQRPIPDAQCEFIIVDDSAKAAAILAQAKWANPASQLTNLAVTGTNGKTTVAFLVRYCMQNAGRKCGLISTIVYDTGKASFEASLTTPDCLTIAERQSQMLKAGAKYMVIEASSHALAQNRLAGINFKAAAFTNLAGDHLDYHKTKEDYLAAKAKLFKDLSSDALAVLNRQAPQTEQIAPKTKAKILWFAVEEPADITAHIESMNINEAVFTLEYANRSSTVKTSLLGRHNVSNHLAAAGLCLATGLNLEAITAGLSSLKTIPGRLEKVCRAGFSPPSQTQEYDEACPTIFIDYAHTDDALKNVLSTIKPLCKGKLIVVFGCGGDRDKTKRPRMARVAEQLADFVVVTSDNPRTEKPADIIDEIVAGFEKGPPVRSTEAPNTKIIEPDRKKAIELAIKTAGKNDIVLIAGKGHETYQIIGNRKFAFDDKEIAQEYLTKRK